MDLTVIDLSREYGIPGNATLTMYVHSDTPEMSKYVQNLDGMVVVPGGGYSFVSEREGEPIAMDFYRRNYNAFVLTYDIYPNEIYPVALTQLACAVDYVRKHAKELRTNPEKISAVGFSAGGHLTANLANFWWRLPQDYLKGKDIDAHIYTAILGYPVISYNSHVGSFKHLLGLDHTATVEEVGELALDTSVTDKNPPTFIWTTAADQCVDPMATISYTAALLKHKITVESHMFPYGGHGMSTCDRTTVADIEHHPHADQCHIWLDLADRFIQKLGQ